MNTPSEALPEQYGLNREPGDGLAVSVQHDLFEFFSAPLPEAEALPLAADTLGEVSKANLRRLEATVSWLQSEVEACRLPQAAQLPLVPGLPVMEAIIDRSSLDRTLHRAPPLPAWLRGQQVAAAPAPPRHGDELWSRVVRFLFACAVAAPLSYLFAVATSPLHKHLVEFTDVGSPVSRFVSRSPRPPEAPDRPRMSMAGPQSAPEEEGALTSEPVVEPPASPGSLAAATAIRPSPEMPADQVPASLAQADPGQAATVQPVPTQAAAPQVETARAQIAPASTTGVAEDRARVAPPAAKIAAPQDVKLLTDRGNQFFEVGDLIAARILFMRAANAGDAAAAVAMGATYDPVVLAGHGVRGVTADLDKARSWYERAKEMGSPEGPRRLEMLANR